MHLFSTGNRNAASVCSPHAEPWVLCLRRPGLRELGTVGFVLEHAGDGVHGGGNAHGALNGFAGQAVLAQLSLV